MVQLDIKEQTEDLLLLFHFTSLKVETAVLGVAPFCYKCFNRKLLFFSQTEQMLSSFDKLCKCEPV